jgi:orotidine-5'-phosphate decarboxylase
VSGERFGRRLERLLRQRGPLCVGIDPHLTLLERWGLEPTVAGLSRFSRTIVEALGDRVAVFKPQSAFFERFGSAGIAVMESTIRQLRDAGALVLLDVKRGDIGTTAQAYAAAYLDPASPLRADALTVNPYLGFGALNPFIDGARAHGGGVFVLAMTSNPEGGQVQDAIVAGGRSVAQTIVDEAGARNAHADGLGDVGVVIGATTAARGTFTLELGALNGPVLAPGLGAQGATADDLRIFAGLHGVVLPAWSREVLVHGPSVPGLREAAARLTEACARALGRAPEM